MEIQTIENPKKGNYRVEKEYVMLFIWKIRLFWLNITERFFNQKLHEGVKFLNIYRAYNSRLQNICYITNIIIL